MPITTQKCEREIDDQSIYEKPASRPLGQALVEYALVLAFVSVVAVCVLMFLGVQLNGVYETIIDALDRVRVAI